MSRIVCNTIQPFNEKTMNSYKPVCNKSSKNGLAISSLVKQYIVFESGFCVDTENDVGIPSACTRISRKIGKCNANA